MRLVLEEEAAAYQSLTHLHKQTPQEEGVEEDATRPAGPFALDQDPLVLHLQAVERGFEAVHLEAVEVEMRVAVAAGSLEQHAPSQHTATAVVL